MTGIEIFENVFLHSKYKDFEEMALTLFRFQAKNNEVYKKFITGLGVRINTVDCIENIPFLPISFFKTHGVLTGGPDYEKVFCSSTTTGNKPSRHFIKRPEIYKQSIINCFELFYGLPSDYTILALLPNYLENKHSSLIYMMDELIRLSGKKYSGYYSTNREKLLAKLVELRQKNEKTLLFGVSFSLLEFCEYEISTLRDQPFNNLIVMETGGMKGFREEIVREDLHNRLCSGLGVSKIHSEYGMTELLSQSYSPGGGRFHVPPWKKVMIREVNDPFEYTTCGITGGINVIDLANIYSCAFIATQDLGRSFKDGSFEVLGRFDGSEMRGCNLMSVG